VSTIKFRSLLLIALASTALPASADFYCCPDPANGRRTCGDTLPDICRGHAYKIIDKAGNVIKEVGPPLTPEQKAAQAAELQRKKEQEEHAREQRRKDQALLDTYSTVKDIDMAQEKAENDLKLTIANADAQIQTIRQRRKKLENEAEFYKKKALPPEIDKGLRSTAHEIKLQEELRDLKKNDFATIKAKYDADRKRYLELTSGPRRATAAPAAQSSGQNSVQDSRPR
jgi:hypothetical protein